MVQVYSPILTPSFALHRNQFVTECYLTFITEKTYFRIIFYTIWEVNVHPSRFNSKNKINQDISADGKIAIYQQKIIKSNSPIIISEEIIFRRNNGKEGILFSLDLDMAFRSLLVEFLF